MSRFESLAGQGSGTVENVRPSQLDTTNDGSSGDLLTKGTGDNWTFATPGGASIANGSIDPVKLADITTGAAQGNKLIALAANGVDFALATPFSLTASSIAASNLNAGTATNGYALFADSTATGGFAWKINAPADSTVTPAKIADITVGSGIAGKLLGFNSDNHAEFAIIDPFTAADIGAGEITGAMLAGSSVDVGELVIDGTPAAGKLLKFYSKSGGGIGLQVADDNSGGGGSNVTLPLNLGLATNFSGLNPVARGGTGASTAAAARVNLGAAAAGSGVPDDGTLPYITDANATPDDHQGRYDDSTANRPDTGSTGGVIWEIEDNQVALETEGGNSGALWVRSKTETNDANWTTPADATITQITTIAQWRALGFDAVRESTLAAAHPQGTSADCAIVKVRGGFAGTGYFLAIVNGSTNPPAWWAAVPGGNSWTAADLEWVEWGNAPNADVDALFYQDYRRIPAGRVGIVASLDISATVRRDAMVAHGFASNSSTFTAYSYSGGDLQSSTIGRAVTAGSWVLAKVGTDQIEDGALRAAAFPTALSAITDIAEHLTLEQMVRGKAFGTTYTHSTQSTGVTAGRFRWSDDTNRILTIHPLSADSTLPEYLLPDVQWELTSTNGARILGSVEAVVANPAGTPAGAYSVRLADHHSLYTGDIRSGNVTVKANGAFVRLGDDVVRISDDAIGLNQLDIEGTQAASKWLRVNSSNSKLEYTDAPAAAAAGNPFTGASEVTAPADDDKVLIGDTSSSDDEGYMGVAAFARHSDNISANEYRTAYTEYTFKRASAIPTIGQASWATGSTNFLIYPKAGDSADFGQEFADGEAIRIVQRDDTTKSAGGVVNGTPQQSGNYWQISLYNITYGSGGAPDGDASVDIRSLGSLLSKRNINHPGDTWSATGNLQVSSMDWTRSLVSLEASRLGGIPAALFGVYKRGSLTGSSSMADIQAQATSDNWLNGQSGHNSLWVGCTTLVQPPPRDNYMMIGYFRCTVHATINELQLRIPKTDDLTIIEIWRRSETAGSLPTLTRLKGYSNAQGTGTADFYTISANNADNTTFARHLVADSSDELAHPLVDGDILEIRWGFVELSGGQATSLDVRYQNSGFWEPLVSSGGNIRLAPVGSHANFTRLFS